MLYLLPPPRTLVKAQYVKLQIHVYLHSNVYRSPKFYNIGERCLPPCPPWDKLHFLITINYIND